MPEPITQYRLPMTVERVERTQKRLGGFKNDRGEDEFIYGPWLWWVHFEHSLELLCFGSEKPDLAAGDEVDIIIRKRNA